MLAIDLSRLPSTSLAVLVARSSQTQPEYLLADRPVPRFLAARWHRRQARLAEAVPLDHHLLSYCERGGAAATIDVGDLRLRARQQAGTITLLPAGRHVRWQLDAPAEVAHLHLYIAPQTLREAWPDDGEPPALINLHDPWLDGFFRLLTAECMAARSAGRLHDVDLLDRLGGPLLRHLARLRPVAGTQREAMSRISPLRPFLLREVQAHVETHLDQRITLDQLALRAGLSVDHFVRAFARATGSTPHRWILEQRLEAARAHLRDGTERVQAIARHCGFGTVAHFSSAFRRRYGVTPSLYRRGAVPTR